MTFKDLLGKIGLVAEAVAVSTIPGASGVDTAVHSIITAKTTTEKEQAIFDSALASLDTFEAFDPSLIADEPSFKDAIINLHKYSIQLKNSLKK